MNPPRLNSLQETVLEELMQRSFGAQDLYIPHRYLRGNALREPADLVWWSNGVAVLFYLTSGKKSLEKQDQHNIEQAKGWLRYWTKKPSHFLKATNRYGDELLLSSSRAAFAIYVSIVSHATGVVFHTINTDGPKGFICSIPESLIHSISSFGGTVIDFLVIIERYSQHLKKRLLRHDHIGSEYLENIVEKSLNELTQTIQSYVCQVDPFPQIDFEFVNRILGLNRLAAPTGARLIASPIGRRQVADFFNDMSAREYLVLSLASLIAIRQTDSLRRTVAIQTQSMYLNWQIIATSIRSSTITGFYESLLSKNKENGIDNLPQLIYGWDIEGADYRSPMMYTMPPSRSSIQARTIVQGILKRLAFAFE